MHRTRSEGITNPDQVDEGLSMASIICALAVASALLRILRSVSENALIYLILMSIPNDRDNGNAQDHSALQVQSLLRIHPMFWQMI